MTSIPPYTTGGAVLNRTYAPEVPRDAEARRSTSVRGEADVVIGAAAAGLSLAALLVMRVIPSVNVAGFVVLAYLLFLVFYGGGVVALFALLLVVGYTFWRGREALIHVNFLISDMQLAGPLDPLSVGGILHAA